MNLKFRAWGRDGNYPGTPSEKFEMFYDVSVVTTYDDRQQHVIADFGIYNESEYNGTEILDYELMQSTGLTDKNGREIFEGDVVKMAKDVYSKPTYYEVVRHEGGTYRLESEQHGCELWLRHADCYIAGNIYENPELLMGTAWNGNN